MVSSSPDAEGAVAVVDEEGELEPAVTFDGSVLDDADVVATEASTGAVDDDPSSGSSFPKIRARASA